ncbi:unnamed protein product [Somion occarium]|uniref:Ribokinase n=1 Tax=Somion occarium TaxID=3059160 RepID=A0ABP1DQV2_9APHY
MSNKPRCLVRGSINVDEFFHVPSIVQPGETLSSTHYERRSGGKGANQAVAVAKGGGDVTLVGAVGSDGNWVLDGLKQVGVDISSVFVTQEEPTGRAIIQLTPQEEAVRSVLFTHLLLQNEIPFASTLSALAHAHRSGATTLFNPSPIPSVEQLRIFPWSQLDWLLVNQGEALSLLRAFNSQTNESSQNSHISIDIPSSWPSRPEIRAAYLLLHRLRANTAFSPKVNLVCTLGGLGVLALLNSGEGLYVPAAKLNGPVKDTTGAGDCFTGYLVAGLMEVETDGRIESLAKDVVERILRRAIEAAGICVQRPGATESIPYRTELPAIE